MRLLLLLPLLLLGCSGSNSSTTSGKPKFAVITNNPAEWWNMAEAGAKKAAKDFDCDVTFRRPSKNDAAEQGEILRALASQNYDGIAVSVINPKDQTPDLNQLSGKLKLVTMDNDAAESGRLCYIGTDNVAAGRSAGRLVQNALPNGGTIAVFVGDMGSLNAQERFKGMMEVLKASGKEYKVHRNEPITDNGNEENAANNARQAMEQLGQDPNACFVGLWAYNPPAILAAAKSKGLAKKVKIIGFDEYDDTLAGIAAGEIEGTIVQDPFNFAYQSVEVLSAEKKGDTSKRSKGIVAHRIISKDGKVPAGETNKGMTVADFKADLDSKLKAK